MIIEVHKSKNHLGGMLFAKEIIKSAAPRSREGDATTRLYRRNHEILSKAMDNAT